MLGRIINGQKSIDYWANVEPAKLMESLAELRKPFSKEVVGHLPKGGVQLDYVGHAATTDRLLSVDPLYAWDYAMRDEQGNPITQDSEGNLLILLTVCGITREGTGDGRTHKERIGDAIRNAAMRFGVALDLWTRDELESSTATRAASRAQLPKASEQQIEAILEAAKRIDYSNERLMKGVAYVSENKAQELDELLEAEAQNLLNILNNQAQRKEGVQQ